MKKQGRWL